MPEPQSGDFKVAVGDSRQLKAKPTDDELLQLYAFYKQGTQDPPIDKAENPGMFDLKGKAKKRAWQKVVDDKVTPKASQTKYVELVKKLKTTYGHDPTKKPEAVGS
ncbi:MAG: hypothetical protein M1827_003942 [Pycnora praestabilis]|nr:MAG: hypothetical protein M1827_003942 [Pycnora praestabilis]